MNNVSVTITEVTVYCKCGKFLFIPVGVFTIDCPKCGRGWSRRDTGKRINEFFLSKKIAGDE